jgi:hypothetical protein
MAHFKVPTAFSFVTELPQTATGKIQKFVLRAGKAAICGSVRSSIAKCFIQCSRGSVRDPYHRATATLGIAMASSLFALLTTLPASSTTFRVLAKARHPKKTAGVLAMTSALNAQQFAGVKANRELPVVWAGRERLAGQQGDPRSRGARDQRDCAVGDRAAADDLASVPLLRGFEKIWHRLIHRKESMNTARSCTRRSQTRRSTCARRSREGQDQGRGAHRFYSCRPEIIVINARQPFATATFGVRVAVLRRHRAPHDRRCVWSRRGHRQTRRRRVCTSRSAAAKDVDVSLCAAASVPGIIRVRAVAHESSCPVAGTAAMFLVGGGILSHGFSGWITGSGASPGPGAGMSAVEALIGRDGSCTRQHGRGRRSRRRSSVVVEGVMKVWRKKWAD